MPHAHLEFMTFTGADDETNLGELMAFQERHTHDYESLCEIALLINPDKTGTPRFPKMDWIERYLDQARSRSFRQALHLCGPAIQQFLSGDHGLWSLAVQFGRVQLNIFAHLYDAPFTADQIDQAAADYRSECGGHVIVPMNDGNAPWVHQLQNPDIQVLFDASAGTGTKAKIWPQGLKNRFHGYAGSLGPETVAEENYKIERVAAGSYWLDGETRFRVPGPTGPYHGFSIPNCELAMRNLGLTV